jgi:hypothetical protein
LPAKAAYEQDSALITRFTSSVKSAMVKLVNLTTPCIVHTTRRYTLPEELEGRMNIAVSQTLLGIKTCLPKERSLVLHQFWRWNDRSVK